MGDAVLTLSSVLLGGILAIVGGVAGGWLQAYIQVRAERRVRLHNLLEPLAIAASRIHLDATVHESLEEEYGLEEANRIILAGVSETQDSIRVGKEVLTRLDFEAPEYRWRINGFYVLLTSGHDVFVDSLRGNLDSNEHSPVTIRQDIINQYTRFSEQVSMVRQDLDQPEWDRFRGRVSWWLRRRRSSLARIR